MRRVISDLNPDRGGAPCPPALAIFWQCLRMGICWPGGVKRSRDGLAESLAWHSGAPYGVLQGDPYFRQLLQVEPVRVGGKLRRAKLV